MKKFLTILPLLAISASALADGQFSLTTGFDYSSGKYGNAASTDILYIPVTGKYEFDKLTVKLTVPYISISGPGGVVQGLGRFGPTTTRTTKITNSGLGDVTASADYNVYAVDALAVDVVGKIKFGTADVNKGLGTGKNDYSAQLDGYYTLVKETSLFATAGYKVVGVPAGVTVNNVPYGTIGVDQKLSDVTNVGVMVNVVKSAAAGGSNQQDVTVYASQKLSDSLKIQADVLKGLSNGSPDFGGGIMITGTF
jgi:hypothetical protein